LFQYVFNVEYETEQQHVFSNNAIQNLHVHTAAGTGLDIYLRHYAFIWWFSLGLFVIAYYHLRRYAKIQGQR